MSKRLGAALLVFTALAQPAFASFGSIADSLETRFGFQRTWIPFLSLARLAVWAVQPKGVHDFQLVVYESRPRVDPREIAKMLGSSVPKGFTPLVRVYSARSGGWSFVYAKPSNDEKLIDLIVLAHDPGQTVLVRVSADAEIVAREFGNPVKVRDIARR